MVYVVWFESVINVVKIGVMATNVFKWKVQFENVSRSDDAIQSEDVRLFHT